jgi:hypothetical protein
MPLPIALSFKLSFERKGERERFIRNSERGRISSLIEGAWDKVKSRLAPLEAGGASR